MSSARPKQGTPWPLLLSLAGVLGLSAILAGGWLYANDPRVHYRIEEWRAYAYDVLNSRPDVLPTPVIAAQQAPESSPTPASTPTSASTHADSSTTPIEPPASPSPSPTPLPRRVTLTGFRHEFQKFNNCGPASVAVNLSYWGWQGSQNDTAPVLKPNLDDKNVSPAEIYNYLTTIGFDAYIRSNGDLDTLKRFIAAGYPVLVEKGFDCNLKERCSGWFGHYSVASGYDDTRQMFTFQDTFLGPGLTLSYDEVLKNWRAFNYLYLVIFPADPKRDAEVSALLGPARDLDQNYRDALARAQREVPTLTGQDAAFAWFSLGTNLHYLQDYAGAAQAYDEARKIGLPYRMAWYQFGMYRAYFYMARYQDVIDVATFAIESTPNPGLEEAFYWRGQAYQSLGQTEKAIEDYKQALVQFPDYELARQALSGLGVTP